MKVLRVEERHREASFVVASNLDLAWSVRDGWKRIMIYQEREREGGIDLHHAASLLSSNVQREEKKEKGEEEGGIETARSYHLQS